MLDTNVAIHLRDRDLDVVHRVAALGDAVIISVITRVELEGGVVGDPASARLRRPLLDAVLASIPAVAFDDMAADAYRQILEGAGYSRRKVLDRMIAAQALVHRATLVTLDAEDFKDIPGLTLLAW